MTSFYFLFILAICKWTLFTFGMQVKYNRVNFYKSEWEIVATTLHLTVHHHKFFFFSHSHRNTKHRSQIGCECVSCLLLTEKKKMGGRASTEGNGFIRSRVNLQNTGRLK